jgi:hypothetical protein
MKKRCDFLPLSVLSPELVYELATLIPLEMDYSRRLMLSTVEFCLVRSWFVSAGRRSDPTVPLLTEPGFSSALVPILCHWTRSRANLGLFPQHPHFIPPSEHRKT